MRIVLWALAGMVLGAVLVVVVMGMIVPSLVAVDQREGGYAMGVIFFMAPAGAIVGGVLGVIIGALRRRQ